MPEADDRRIPDALGKYKIIQRLAVGGMAELFLARVTGIEGFEKYVVVKRILPQHAQDRHFVDMFLDEARLAARLDHQNIVQVHDIGQEAHAYFFVMEYLHGEDAQELLKVEGRREQRIPLEQALTIITGVAAGLQYAHEKCDTDGLPLHIVHRDVAPSNIIVTYDGGVKLVDFGIARAHFRQSQTEAGRVKGKLSYMSPEQCRGEELDARSDLFSLGIVTYELTTMSRLFRVRRSKKLEVMQRIAKGDIPPPSTRMADYPPALEQIVMRALQVSRKKRYQSAGEMLRDLEGFAKEENMSLSPSNLAWYLRESVGHRPEPWRIDRPSRPEVDTGKTRRDEDEAALKISRATTAERSVPTDAEPIPSFHPNIVQAETTAIDHRGHSNRRRNIALIIGTIVIFGLLVAIAQLGSPNEVDGQAKPAATEPAPADTALELSPDPSPAATASDEPTAESNPEETSKRRKRSKKSRRDKRSERASKSERPKSERPKGDDSSKRRESARPAKATASKKSAAKEESRDKNEAKKARAKRDPEQKSPRRKDVAEKTDDTFPAPTKDRKKWDSPFPPSAGE